MTFRLSFRRPEVQQSTARNHPTRRRRSHCSSVEILEARLLLVSTGLFGNTLQTLGESNTAGIALGDVDGDGDLDVFTANSYGNTGTNPNRVWLNDGAGNLTDSGQRLGNSSSEAVDLGDLDGDGDLDAFVANHGFGSGVEVRANKVWLNDGGGTFVDSGQRLGNDRSFVVSLGDLDGDGDLDAFVGNKAYESRHNKVWLNDGRGTFVDSGQELGNSTTEDVVLGDFDGDGDLDALVVNQRGDFNMDRLWLNEGDGTFIKSDQTLGERRMRGHTVDTGDVDGDGDLDAVIATRFERHEGSRVLLNDGNGQFTLSDGFTGAAEELALGDFDADGDLDVFTTAFNGNSVWLNSGNGRFQDSGQTLIEGRGQAVALGDLDSDGDLDAALGSRDANKVWLNADVPYDLSVTSTNDQYFATPGQSLQYTIRVTNDGPENADNASVAVGFSRTVEGVDWQCLASAGSTCTPLGTGDIDDTVSVAAGGSVTYTATGILSTDAQGSIVNGATVTTDGGSDVTPFNNSTKDVDIVLPRELTPGVNDASATRDGAISVGLQNDVEADSVSDDTFVVHGGGTGRVPSSDTVVDGPNIVVNPSADFHPGETVQVTTTSGIRDADGPTDPYVWQFSVETAPASGLLENTGQLLGFGRHQSAELGDIDGDGDLDVVVGDTEGDNQVWVNDGTGTMSDSGQTLGRLGHSLALGDLDGDHDLDVFIAKGRFQPTPDRVWLNDGAGNFVDTGQSLGEAISWSTKLGDLDGDGDLDAFVANSDSPNNVWLNDGTGQFTDSGQRLGDTVSRGVALADLDADGDLDAIVANAFQNDSVWLNDGAGNFVSSGQRLDDDRSTYVATGDIDGDGDVDALFAAGLNRGSSRIWLNSGDGHFVDSGQTLSEGTVVSVALGDIDGDRDLDAFIGRVGGGAGGTRIWLNDGKGSFTESSQVMIGARGFSMPLGDLDGDDDLDVFFANVGASQVWLNQGLPGDANGDGVFDRLDIVQVLQRGKFTTDEFAGWQDGDWNLDGVFDQDDLVVALQGME